MSGIRRREFVRLLGGTAAAWPLAARAQQSERVRKLGVLAPAAAGTPLWQGYLAAFREDLEKLGWSPRNVAIEERWGADAEQVRSHAAELVAMAPDVILGGAATGSRALLQATRTIPIVFAFVPDPVALGLVTSLARPGGNITGFANYEPVVAVKWLELLKQIAPAIMRVTFLNDPINPVVPAYMRQLEAVASSFAVTMSGATVHNAEEIERALNQVAQAPNSGLIVAPGPPIANYQALVLGLAAQHRLPAVYPFHEVVKNGGLASYGVDGADLFRRAASYVDRILKGEKPGDLPVQFATKFQLAINLKTAKALGLDPPIQLLARTDVMHAARVHHVARRHGGVAGYGARAVARVKTCKITGAANAIGANMKFGRRQLLSLATGAAAASIVSRGVGAQTYPSRVVRIVVGFVVGGFYDTYARLIAQWLSEHLGQPFVIENRTGAGGSIATEAVVRAAPDGYTLLFTGSNDAWNTALYENLSFNYVRDIAPVASFSKGMGVLVVPPSFPATTVQEFIAYARDNPAKVTIASDGVGSGPHVFWELFRSMTGLNTLHVPYRGATPVIVDLLSAQVQAYFGYLAPLIEYVRRGQLRPLAVTSAVRAEALPNVPTIDESISGYDATGWNGIGAPRNTPVEIIEKLNKAVNAGFADPRIKLRIAQFGDQVFASSPEEFGKHIVEFTNKWSKVIRAANIKQPELPIIGLIEVGGSMAGPTVAAFQKGLAEAGYVEGQNATIDFRPMTSGQPLSETAAELIRRRVAVIVTLGSTPAALAAKVATTAVPVVFAVADDPVQIGLVASLNRPGGNVTGVTLFGSELGPKKLELLREVSPTTKRIAVLVNPSNGATSDADIAGARAAAQRLGLEIVVVNAGNESEIEGAFSSAVQQGAGAVYIGSDALLTTRREQIAELALRRKLLTMSSERAAVRAGQLMGYGAFDVEMYRQAGVYVGRLLKGEKAADLPVVQPTKFDLVINLTTAKALGLTIPEAFLLRADEVIE